MRNGGRGVRPLKTCALRELARAPARLAALYDILQTPAADLDFERSFARCLQKLRSVCCADRGGIYLLENDSYRSVASAGLPERSGSRLRLDRGAEPLRTAERRRAPVIGGPPAACAPGAQSSLAAPLRYAGRHVGALLLTARRAGRMTREHGLFVSLITDKLAQALVSSREMRRLARDARTDGTTGLPNARASARRLEQELARAEREGTTVGVLFLDIDGLKPVNDRCGHSAGDKLLAAAGLKLEQSLRSLRFRRAYRRRRISGDPPRRRSARESKSASASSRGRCRRFPSQWRPA